MRDWTSLDTQQFGSKNNKITHKNINIFTESITADDIVASFANTSSHSDSAVVSSTCFSKHCTHFKKLNQTWFSLLHSAMIDTHIHSSKTHSRRQPNFVPSSSRQTMPPKHYTAMPQNSARLPRQTSPREEVPEADSPPRKQPSLHFVQFLSPSSPDELLREHWWVAPTPTLARFCTNLISIILR